MRRLALVTAVLAASMPARAEPVPPKARKLAEHGREMHRRGEYERAVTAFKEAYVIAPSAGLLFNLAQAYRLQGNCDDAALMYRRYLATSPPADARAVAQTHLATVERCVHKRGLNIPLDESMAYLNVPPPPGPEAVLEPDRREADDRREVPRPRRLERDVGVGLVIGGGAALATAAYFGLASYRAARDVEAAYEGGAKWSEVRPIHERGERAELAAKIFGIGGGLAVAGGVTLWLLGRRDERTQRLAVTPATGHGAEVSYAWSF